MDRGSCGRGYVTDEEGRMMVYIDGSFEFEVFSACHRCSRWLGVRGEAIARGRVLWRIEGLGWIEIKGRGRVCWGLAFSYLPLEERRRGRVR